MGDKGINTQDSTPVAVFPNIDPAAALFRNSSMHAKLFRKPS